MQNQIFRGLFINLLALTLSACVGSVTLPAGTIAETKTEKTESAPIVLTPEAILINKCIIGNTAQSDPTCAKAVADTNGCITNPFLSGCEANPLFSPHVQNARDERVKFCNDANNEEDSLCTGSDSVKDICTHDPFSRVCGGFYYQERKLFCEDTLTFPRCADIVSSVCRTDPFNTKLCFGDDTYNREREIECSYRSSRKRCENTISRVCDADPFNTLLCFHNADYNDVRETACAGKSTSSRCATTVSRACDNNPFHPLCANNPIYETAQIRFCDDNIRERNNGCPQIILDCLSNPFGDNCIHDFFQNKRINRLTFCGILDNKNHATCAVALSRPNVASFLQSFDRSLSTLSSVRTAKTDFVQGMPWARTPIINLATGDGNQSLGGDATDGFYIAHSNQCNSCILSYYTGILSGTDLGAPRIETTGTAEWNGIFSSVGNEGSPGMPVSTNFILTINFSTGAKSGTITASVGKYSLTGDFDNSGVIRGSIENNRILRGSNGVDRNYRHTGILRGLIGQEGAVGVFISNNDVEGAYPYVGGFVARPPSE